MERTRTEWMREPLKKYAQFTGRSTRPEYWWYALYAFVAFVAASTYDLISGLKIGLILIGALVLPGIAVTVRRLHDVGRSGWWLLIGLIPLVGTGILLWWNCQPGTIGPNRFGPDPKGRDPVIKNPHLPG